MSPRVLVVGPLLSVGGTERHLAQVLPAMAARDIEVRYFALQRGGELEDVLKSGGVPISGPKSFGRRSIRNLSFIFGLRRELGRFRPDLVHLFLPEPTILGAIACEAYGSVPYVASRRSLAIYRERRPIVSRVDRFVSKRAAGLIGNSSAVVAQLEAECGDRRKVGLVHNGVALPQPLTAHERDTYRSTVGVGSDAPLIAVVANLIPYKGHLDLIAGIGQIREQLPPGFRLALIGRDDGQGVVIDHAAERAGIAGNLVRLGLRVDARRFLAAADLAILPSHQEGFSNALIEGMAAGVPTIATAIGGNTDAIEDGRSGVLVPVGDPVSLGRAVLRLIEDRGLASLLANEGRRRVRLLFDENTMMDRYERLYRSVKELACRPLGTILDGTAPAVETDGK